MPRVNLTNTKIRKFRYEGDGRSRDVRWDETFPGFGVRIYPSNRKAFVLKYRLNEKQTFMVVGDFGTEYTLNEARNRARELRVGIRKGTDPLEEKKKAKSATTFGDLSDKFIEQYAKIHKRTWETDQGRLKRHIPSAWRGRKIKEIKRSDLEKLHNSIGKTRPYEANRTLDLLRVVFRQARLWDDVDFDHENPAEGIRKFPEKKRRRWAKPEEIRLLAASIDLEPDLYVRAALWLYMLTGARKTELLTARRSDIDWKHGSLRLPETKSGEEQSLTLSRPALAILQSIPAFEKNPYLFPGSVKGKHRVNIDKAWRRVRKRASVAFWTSHEDEEVSSLVQSLGENPSFESVIAATEDGGIQLPPALHDLRLHDLRRTVGSWLTQGGVDLNKVKDALRHSNISTTLIYARLGEDPVRDAMEGLGEQLLEAVGKR